jgi:hypothetical protein
LELQIAYKLFLGSDKDLQDARHLYDLFRDNIDKEAISDYASQLNVSEEAKKLVL